jgi:hypothetical protein
MSPPLSPVTNMKFVSSLLLVLASVAAAQCPEPNRSWVVEDDGINGVVSVEGRPLKQANIQLSSSTADYSAVTDAEGAFLIPNVALGSYSFVVKGWGEAHIEVKGWHRGGINRPVLLFNSIKKCLLLTLVSN